VITYKQINNDPSLPSFVDARYRKLAPWWQFVQDMYQGRSAWVSFLGGGLATTNLERGSGVANGYAVNIHKAYQYLPKESEEDDYDWYHRVIRSYFHRKFGDAIDAFAGLLTNFTVNGDLPKSLKLNIENVDMKGNSLSKFLLKADIAALRDGFCLILVDYPRTINEDGESTLKTVYDTKKAALRPRLVMYEANQVINYSFDEEIMEFEHITIQESVEMKAESGYETTTTEQYRTLRADSCEVNKVSGSALVGYQFPVKAPTEKIPLIVYTASVEGEDPLEAKPPLLDLAELNLNLYQKTTQKDELMLRCNIPILQINERTNGRKKDVADGRVKIGANTILWNVDAQYVEPNGGALALTAADITKLNESIAERTLNFLSLGIVQRTATEIVHSAAPLAATFSTMADAKKSAVQVIFETWGMFTGEKTNATIEIDHSIIQAALDTPKVSGLLALRNAGELSRRTFLEIMQAGKVLPNGLSVDEEIERIKLESNQVLSTTEATINVPT
jgi:hypothetical protein